ncbi:MAG: hypothetical protein OWQ59_01545 [Alicyclobacillaceae bacterium]|jgi:hypothetical protein|nr:hypothetical protein [Alicyclobacillus sp. SP_1]MCY0887117.1 hypothetical protein [Alicyclobacillaceae bacterium]MCY0895402.1 hypothetical protein [Alicyclobacillaceae bacterium]
MEENGPLFHRNRGGFVPRALVYFVFVAGAVVVALELYLGIISAIRVG